VSSFRAKTSIDAQATFDQRTNEAVVSFRFDNQGATRFGQTTQQNVGRLFAIILDNQVISAPQIREPILGGSGQISGNFTVQSANDLAVLLRAGALPADLTIVEERTVGPSLGADSINAPVRSRRNRRRDPGVRVCMLRGLWLAWRDRQHRASGQRRAC
jgi:protein-export membrane protein SecD